jgi:hypothetical protein
MTWVSQNAVGTPYPMQRMLNPANQRNATVFKCSPVSAPSYAVDSASPRSPHSLAVGRLLVDLSCDRYNQQCLTRYYTPKNLTGNVFLSVLIPDLDDFICKRVSEGLRRKDRVSRTKFSKVEGA